MLLSRRTLLAGTLAPLSATRRIPRVAAVVTAYFRNSHADLIVSRLLQGENLDGKSRVPRLELAGLYVDQLPANDISGMLSTRYGFPIFPTIRQALTLGGEKLAVDGVLLIGEHGTYPHNELDQELYPRKRFFEETVAVFRDSHRVVPVFNDKHLSHSWDEARAMYRTARRLCIPLMAGSSVPGTWRRPAVEVPRGARLREIAVLSYHTLYGYGFHALELLQALAERRYGGETGVREVQCLTGEPAWRAWRDGRCDPALLRAAIARLSHPAPRDLERAVPSPTLFLIRYGDGLHAAAMTLNPAVGEWSAAWDEAGRSDPSSALFWTQEERPLGHFTFLLRGIERFVHTGTPPWPVERTLLTSGVLDALLHSRRAGGLAISTPHLAIRYDPPAGWSDPGPPPPGRPLDQP